MSHNQNNDAPVLARLFDTYNAEQQTEHEKQGFIDGVRVGIQLAGELSSGDWPMFFKNPNLPY